MEERTPAPDDRGSEPGPVPRRPGAPPPAGAGHRVAVLQALAVTALWSSSWVLIKIGLAGLPPLGFAGLRYGLAALLLLPGTVLAVRRRGARATLGQGGLAPLVALGVVMYAVTQGAQFAALARLPAATLALVLSMTPLLVASASWWTPGERPTPRQLAGVALLVAGAAAYLLPDAAAAPPAGLAIAGLGLAANAAAALLGRRVNRSGGDPLAVTGISMTVGAALLLGAGLALEGWPALDPRGMVIVGWLALVNTAFAFTLWNRTLRVLTATESSVVNNTMLIQIAVLAWVFLGETLSIREVAGLAVAAAGALVVQLRR